MVYMVDNARRMGENVGWNLISRVLLLECLNMVATHSRIT